ncbi:hypothetical protein BDQ17DRAFT_1395239 [Cyathus striatus]|nr:hypothetical protein BDQ17DRAFT_1395239 [Cyathus striatus]
MEPETDVDPDVDIPTQDTISSLADLPGPSLENDTAIQVDQQGDHYGDYADYPIQLEWDIAKWAKLQGSSSNVFDQLIQIDGVIDKLGLSFHSSSELNQRIDDDLPGCPHFVWKEICIGNEICDVYFQDIIDCVKALLGDPNFAPYLVFEPEKHYTDDSETTRMYHDMHTERWWWEKQKQLEVKTPGSTITHQKPSARAYVLLGHLSTTHLEGVTNKSSQWHMLANLYHACMSTILKPLETLGEKGFQMTTADGCLQCMHPLFAVFIADYPEQVLTICVYYGDCPTCPAIKPELEDFDSDVSSYYVLDSFDVNAAVFLQTCQESQVKSNLPYVNVYQSISPDILHQLHQAWIVKAFGETEIDAHYYIPLPHGILSARLVHCVPQYPIHTDKTLTLLEQSLDYNLPKLHFAEDYVKKIKLFGTTDNYNTEYTEQLHIDLAKEAYRASNHKDEFKQMTRWLERKENIYHHEQYIAWCISGKPVPKVYEWQPPGLELDRTMHLSKFPSAHKVSLDALEIEYGAIDFRNAFANSIKKELWGVHMSLKNYWVWHCIKYQRTDQYTGNILVSDSIQAHPISHTKTSYIPGQFDTALIQKELSKSYHAIGAWIGLRPSIPGRLIQHFPFPHVLYNPEHLAYVEYIPDEPHPNHLMYKISPKKDKDGDRLGEIISVERIQRSVHLFPKFGSFAPVQWTSSTVLDLCDTFFINSFTDKHLYHIFV